MFLAAALLALHLPQVAPDTPNRQPQLAVGNGVAALAFGSGDSIWLVQSKDNGRTWGAPSKVGEIPKMLLGRHRGPRVAFAGKTIVVSAIQSELYAWRSTDGEI